MCIHPKQSWTAALKPHVTCRSFRHSSCTRGVSFKCEPKDNLARWHRLQKSPSCPSSFTTSPTKEQNDQKAICIFSSRPRGLPSALLSLSCPGRRCSEAKFSMVKKFWLSLNEEISVYTCIRNSSGLYIQEHE